MEQHSIEMLAWFWKEHKAIGQVSFADGFCQCESECFINRSSDPDKMRAICLVGTFIDQLIHCHFRDIYPEFSEKYRYPKLHSCHGAGMIHPSWFIYTLTNSYWVSESERQGFRPQENWQEVRSVAITLFEDLFSFLNNLSKESSCVTKFKRSALEELSFRFNQNTQDVLGNVLNEI